MKGSKFRRLATAMMALLLAGGTATLPAAAQDSGMTNAPPLEGIALRPPEELDQLLAPIALYPDALVALILPAATVPGDIARAADYLRANRDPDQIAGQPWDASVRALAHYPDLLRWLDENLTWTQQVGEVFSVQPADVMKSIQQLRARAIAAGTLVSTPEQQVIADGGEIRIVPGRSDTIYVPRYDPAIVYEGAPAYGAAPIIYGSGYATGSWLDYDVNWSTYGIWVGAWYPGLDFRRPVWRRPLQGTPVVGRPWRPATPPPRRVVWPVDPNRHRSDVVHARPFPGVNVNVRPPDARNGAPGAPPHRDVSPVPQPVPPPAWSGWSRPNPRGYPPPTPQPSLGPVPNPNPPVVSTPTPRPVVTPVPAPGPITVPERGPNRVPDLNRPRVERPMPTTPPPSVQHSNPPFSPAPPAGGNPPQNFLGGYNRGSDVRDASHRGQESRRVEPPPSAPAPAPQRQIPPPVHPAPPATPAQPPASEPPPDKKRDPR